MGINNTNISELNTGLHTDTSPQNQPKGTYRFGLNTVNETNKGDEFFRSNEESNEKCYSLTPGFIPIGKCYIGNNEIVLFSVLKNNTTSEIGILKNNCNYEVHVNDEFSALEDKLGFTIENQIQATYRLRRGCERTVYFTDDNKKPRYYNFDKPQDFKNDDGKWVSKKFNLFKEYEKLPVFEKIKILNGEGNIKPGSINISIQYVDEGLNPTEWITTSHVINIYNDSLNNSFNTTNGSINSQSDYLNFGNTNKAIEILLSNIDTSFSFYKLAFIESTNGSGQINNVKFTEIIPTSNNRFIYTGENATTQGTEEEILFSNDTIYKANSIEQIENRLLLGNTQGKQIDYCKLQKYASKIKADCVLKEVILNDKESDGNLKNPILDIEGKGYMPGEIYSFGIVYIFEDGSLSPVYHIPGKGPTVGNNIMYTSGANIKPMKNNNQSINNKYFDNNSCVNSDYWGLDDSGIPLKDTFVRHHRFPKRSEINVPLVEEISTSSNTTTLYRLKINIKGNIKIPLSCPTPPGTCVPQEAPPFLILVTYTVDSVEYELTYVVNPSIYQNNVISTYNIDLNFFSAIHTNSVLTINSIKEIYEDDTESVITIGTASPKNLIYSSIVEPFVNTSETKLYKTKLLGIKFSGIEMPNLADSNGEKIIGYYIVRNERTKFEKTILDTAILTPSVINSKYVSHGLLQPEINSNKLSKDIFGIINPRYKFEKEEISEFTSIEQEGNFDIIGKKYGKFRYNDVTDGTSFDAEIHKDGELEDENNKPGPDDGWSLKCIVRDNITKYKNVKNFNITSDQKKELFYLNAVESRNVNDDVTTIYNISSDNKIGMLQTKTDDIVNPTVNNLPYVLINRNIADSYSNFRTLPYYKETMNPILFDNSDSNEVEVFHGDTYVQPMRYTNTVFWDNTIAERAGKTSVLNYIIGGVLILAGILAIVGTFGVATTLVVGTGISIIGGGALFISSGLEKDAFVKAYNEEYKKGLRETTLDEWVNRSYVNIPNHPNGPMDDEIRWIADCITDLWFDTDIDISLRHKMKSDVPTFLNAPGKIEDGNVHTEEIKEYFNKRRYWDWTILPISSLERHISAKLNVFNASRKDNKFYLGAALGEWYEVNPDYHRKNKQKIFYHLPLEYDCCSDCKEDFPHRWHWSEQSFQEELTDNYRTFLPNNYKDLEGETGEITNMFKIGNNLFMHTKEALWQIPRNYQERVTDQIISFIGTGSYGEIPAQKVLDDDTGSSAGSQHKWGLIKTPNGVFFPSENQRKIYQFDGKQLQPISSIGNGNWFQNNMELLMNKQYYDSTGRIYPYNNNPSNPFGTGFISTYDTKKERIIFTKKDFLLDAGLIDNPDFELCINNGQVIYFPNYNQIIQTYQTNGWNYIGIENCKMKFEKTVTDTKTEIRQTIVNLPNNADIIIWLDTSGSFDETARQVIKDAIGYYDTNGNPTPSNSWLANFANSNPNWTGDLHYIEAPGPDGGQTERWIDSLRYAKYNNYNGNITGKNIIMVSFVNESASEYHNGIFDGNIDNPQPTYLENYNGNGNTSIESFLSVYNEVLNTGGTNKGSFYGLAYPIVFTREDITAEYLKHVLAAVNGIPFTSYQVDNLLPNPGVGNWNLMKSALQTDNPYPDNGIGGLNQQGWKVITNRFWGGSGQVITAEQFQEDMNAFLQGNTSIEQIEVEVDFIKTIYEYVEGRVLINPIELNNSWTMSYSLKQNSWVSWHSYLPNFYINVPEKFYSWVYGNNNIWKHNKEGHYQTFYDKLNPFILEYVSLSNPLTTRIWEYLMLLVEVKKYDNSFKEFTDINNRFFNKLIAYNSRQCSGLMNIKVKDADEFSENYLYEQINNLKNNEIIVDRNERNWTLNNLRDIRTNYNEPIFNSNLSSLQTEYFIDKILNNNSINYEKDWSELESFRDKYLVVRLIFDNFADGIKYEKGSTKMIMNFLGENETHSFR
jgi:hypothetical protein